MDRNIISQTQIDTTIKNPVSFLEVNIDNCKIPHSVPEFDRVWKKAFENLKIEKENLLEEIENVKKKRLFDENEKRNKIQNLQKRINEIEIISVKPELWAKICWSVIREGKVNKKNSLQINIDPPPNLPTNQPPNPPTNPPPNPPTNPPPNLSQLNQKEKDIRLPNGCCNMTDCSLNLYYSLLIEELSKD